MRTMVDQTDPVARLAVGLRDVLRRIDDDLVPVSLNKVMAHTGTRLTPPLTKRLFDELDSNEWLRTQMVDHVDTAEDPLAAAYLARDAGWWRVLAQAGSGSTSDAAAVESARALSQARGRLDEAKRRLKQLREQNTSLETELRNERSQRRRSATSDHVPQTELTARIVQLEAELGSLAAERDRLEMRIDDLRRRRPEQTRRNGDDEQHHDREFGRTAPTELARRLDLEFAAFTSPAGHVGVSSPAPDPERLENDAAAQLRVPDGIAPDSADAVAWLATVDDAVHVIVDGYNVTFLRDPASFRSGPVRRQLVDHLAPLRRRLPSSALLEVIFDSAEGADSDPILTAAGVTVRFTMTGVIADDEIVETVRRSVLPTVVVSNDRELRSRAEAIGAIVLWGDALVAWLGH